MKPKRRSDLICFILDHIESIADKTESKKITVNDIRNFKNHGQLRKVMPDAVHGVINANNFRFLQDVISDELFDFLHFQHSDV